MQFDFAALAPKDRYKLLSGVVVPRPIALITTLDAAGTINAAPFSFFNVFAEDPPLVVVGLQLHADGRVKDTTRNIRASGLFVVNMVDEALAQAMHDCAVEFPAALGEPQALGLACTEGTHIPVPHLAAAPVALECRRITTLSFGPERDLVVGEVLGLHARDGIIDPTSLRTDAAALAPVGRLGGCYVRLRDRFGLDLETYEDWSARSGRTQASAG